MPEKMETKVGTMRIRRRDRLSTEASVPQHASQIQWKQPEKRRPGEKLLRNMALAASLTLCAVTLRSGALPELSSATDAILSAATDDSLLNDQLGRLSFVSTLFPEASLVFAGADEQRLSMPVSGGMVVHAWSESEPYLSWRTDNNIVTATASGEVIGVYHGNGDERLVQVLGEDGISCLYGNLEDTSVRTGDAVLAGETIGTLMTGADCVFEVRRNGMSIDPALYMGTR